MQKTKGFLVLCCILILMLPALVPLFLELRVFLIKWEAGERMENENLQTIHLSNKDIHWNEKGKELLISGRLFDVKNLTETKDGIEASGIFDDEETTVQLKIENFWKEKKSKDIPLLLKYFHVLDDSYLLKQEWNLVPSTTIPNKMAPGRTFYLQNIFIRIPSPPPQA